MMLTGSQVLTMTQIAMVLLILNLSIMLDGLLQQQKEMTAVHVTQIMTSQRPFLMPTLKAEH